MHLKRVGSSQSHSRSSISSDFLDASNRLGRSKDLKAKVPDFDSKIMKGLMRFVCRNEVEDLDKLARDLIFAAEKYIIEKLINLKINLPLINLLVESLLAYMIFIKMLFLLAKFSLFHKFQLFIRISLHKFPLNSAVEVFRFCSLTFPNSNKRTRLIL